MMLPDYPSRRVCAEASHIVWRLVGAVFEADQTDSPTFRRWFGDSKVVDRDGRPLVAYHGTGADIGEFDYGFTDQGNDQIGSGFYFSTSPQTASGYATARGRSDTPKPGGENANVMPVYLAIRNPLDAKSTRKLTSTQIRSIISKAPELDDKLGNFDDIEYVGRSAVMNKAVRSYVGMPIMHGLNSLANDFYPGQVEAFNQAVRDSTGYDGVFDKYPDETHWVAWFPWQIKSAVGNRGAWSTGSRHVGE